MNNNIIIIKIKNWILRFIQVQLLVSLISLPILASWGFPISILSPVGNMIFTPFFMLFLLISSILFFFEILFIPNGFLVYFLNKITSIWLYCMPSNNYTPFIGFTKPSIIFVIVIPVATISILFFKKAKTVTSSIFFLSLLLLTSVAYLKIIQAPKPFIKQLPCYNGHVTFIYNSGKIIIIDPGVIGSRISSISWLKYKLLPEIVKSCGKTHIDHLVLMAPGKLLFEAIENLCKSVYIKNIYLVCWTGQLPKNILRSFYFMQKAALNNNTKIKRISKVSEIINLPNLSTITLTPIEKKLTYKKATYPAICATCTIDNTELKIYSAKYKKYLCPQKKHSNLPALRLPPQVTKLYNKPPRYQNLFGSICIFTKILAKKP